MLIEEIKPGSFVYMARNVLGNRSCEEMISRFEERFGDHRQGQLGQHGVAAPLIKSTVDVRVSGVEYWRDVDQLLFQSLGSALTQISKLHPFFLNNSFKDTGYHLQRYTQGDYYHWHIDSGPGSFSQRQLVAIWYLNSVTCEGGELNFAYQDISIKPEAGSLILFPPFWTHLHRSAKLLSGSKYIATTWVCFS